MIVNINVTEEHIKQGIEGSCSCCPISLAIKEKFPWINEISTFPHTILFWNKNHSAFFVSNISNEKEVLNFIDDFDNGENKSPFSFKLDIKLKYLV